MGQKGLKFVLFLVCIFAALNSSAQETQRGKYENQYGVQRILLIVDASGSMKTDWSGRTKWDIAKELITQTIDSIEQVNKQVEFAIRLFGHQSPRVDENCEDTKLEVPFRKYNNMNIVSKLNEVTPQGQTPIAFSIFSCLNDFPRDPNAKNSIILVTDGAENCEGDVCALGLELERRRITMKPFIIGMGLTKEEQASFECIGTYYDAADEQGFQNSMNAVMSQAMHNTTTTVNLIQKNGKPEETDVEMSFYDHHSGALVYNMTHTMNEDKRPDTLYVSPIGIYDLKIHTIPSVIKENIELVPGRHNTIGMNVHVGGVIVNWNRPDGKMKAQVLVKQSNTDSTLYVTEIDRMQKFLTGYYDVEVLTIPEKKFDSVLIKQSELTKLKLPNPGTFRINVPDVGYASVYKVVKGEYIKVYEFYNLKEYAVIQMLPGNYAVVYQGKGNYDSEETQHRRFRISPFKPTSITFN